MSDGGGCGGQSEFSVTAQVQFGAAIGTLASAPLAVSLVRFVGLTLQLDASPSGPSGVSVLRRVGCTASTFQRAKPVVKAQLSNGALPTVTAHSSFASSDDAALMKQQLPKANLARIVGVLWDNARVGDSGDGPLTPGDCMTDTPPYFREKCFDKLDKAVRQCVENKVWVILAARCEYAAGQEFNTHPQRNVFHNATLASMLFTMWRHVAAHYASWPYIAAFEVMSEPRDKGASAAVVTDFYTKACGAAQAAAPGTPCVVGPGPY